jgi:hypothetical protein
MKNYEDRLSNDTVLGAGLVAIAIAWVLLAAVRGPLDPMVDGNAAGYAMPAAYVQAPAGAGRTVVLPASAQRSDSGKVS